MNGFYEHLVVYFRAGHTGRLISMMYFCVSPQRSGTKSFGEIAKGFGFDVFSWSESRDHGIAKAYLTRDWNKIGAFLKTKSHLVFEDSPYFNFEFVKWAFYNTDSKFIYLGRDANKWYESMLTHSGGAVPGSEMAHADSYSRWMNLASYLQITDIKIDYDTKGLTNMMYSKEIYVDWYIEHKRNILNFFAVAGALRINNGKESRLFYSEWENLDLSKLANFMGVQSEIPAGQNVGVVHATKRKKERLRGLYLGE